MSDAITIADQEHKTAMARGSALLLKAIKIGRTDRHNLIWRTPHENMHTWRAQGFDAKRQKAALSMAHKERVIASAIHRDICPHCGTRTDIGCQHRRAA